VFRHMLIRIKNASRSNDDESGQATIWSAVVGRCAGQFQAYPDLNQSAGRSRVVRGFYGGRIMKIIGSELALLAVLAIAFVIPGRAIERGVVPSKDFEAKVQYCKT
jgi:hypothetical protein